MAESDYLARPGAVDCVARYRGGLANLRTQFTRIVERAGSKAWSKMFVNSRSTRRTELQERFADHVVNSWLGHSGAAAAKLYLQVTDEHWARAIGAGSPAVIEGVAETRGKLDSGVPTGVPIADNHGPSPKGVDIKKPRENPRFDGVLHLSDACEMTPTGFEPVLPP